MQKLGPFWRYYIFDLCGVTVFEGIMFQVRYIEKLNEYGKQGWRLISGTDDWKYSIFEREIEDEKTGLKKEDMANQ